VRQVGENEVRGRRACTYPRLARLPRKLERGFRRDGEVEVESWPLYRHTAPRGASEDRRAMSRENEGAERAHPRDWPARCGYEVRELDRHDGEVYSRSRSASSTRTRVPGPTCTQLRTTIARPDYKHEEDGEYGVWEAGRRRGWREGEGTRAGQGQEQAMVGRVRRECSEGEGEGAGLLLLERCVAGLSLFHLLSAAVGERCMWGRGDRCSAKMEGWECYSRKARESALRIPVVSLAARLGGVVELEPPLGPFCSSCWSHALMRTCHLRFLCAGAARKPMVAQWCVRAARYAHASLKSPWLRCSRCLSLWRGCGGAGVQAHGLRNSSRAYLEYSAVMQGNIHYDFSHPCLERDGDEMPVFPVFPCRLFPME
jgi:hypothetical protein